MDRDVDTMPHLPSASANLPFPLPVRISDSVIIEPPMDKVQIIVFVLG